MYLSAPSTVVNFCAVMDSVIDRDGGSKLISHNEFVQCLIKANSCTKLKEEY